MSATKKATCELALDAEVDAESPTLDHRGSAHGDGGALGGDDDIATSAVFHANVCPLMMLTRGGEAGELRELGERVCVEGGAHATVSNAPFTGSSP